MMLDLETFIRSLTEEGDWPSVEAICEANSIRSQELYNATALEIARRFDSGRISFEHAASAMNVVWGMMIEDPSFQGDREPAEPAFSIYKAFDAGEYDHGDGEDPIERYAKPTIKSILARA